MADSRAANIWSHLLGASFFVLSLYHFCSNTWPRLATAPLGDAIVICVYYFGVVNCFILSTRYEKLLSADWTPFLTGNSFHVFSNHSSEMHRFGNELDHLGVVMVIFGSTIPATYFAFYCQQNLQILYWTIVCMLPSS